MTCDPVTLLKAAQTIHNVAADEGMYRAAVNRAYYASYHYCRIYNAKLPYLGKIAGNGVHEQLISQLTFPSKKLTANSQDRATAVGKYLRQICALRVHADYIPDKNMTSDEMASALSTAETIFSYSEAPKAS